MEILRKIAEWGSGLWITATSGTSAAGLSVQRHVTSRSRLGRVVAPCLPGATAQPWRN